MAFQIRRIAKELEAALLTSESLPLGGFARFLHNFGLGLGRNRLHKEVFVCVPPPTAPIKTHVAVGFASSLPTEIPWPDERFEKRSASRA
jgi:hypothetical protein